MKNMFVGALAGLLITSLSVTAFAFGPGFGRGHEVRGANYTNDMISRSNLNLTADQVARVRELWDAHRKDVKPIRDKMFAAQVDLRLLWQQANPDESKIAAAQKELKALRDQMEEKTTSHRLSIFKVLTQEQQIKLQNTGFRAGKQPGMKMGSGGGTGPGFGHGPGPGEPCRGGNCNGPMGGL